MNLPIDVIPGTNPPRFRWKQTVSTPDGTKTVECEGNVPAGVEQALVAVIALAKKSAVTLDELHMEIKDLKDENEELRANLDGKELGKNDENRQVTKPPTVAAQAKPPTGVKIAAQNVLPQVKANTGRR